MYRNILIPTDGSELAGKAVEHGIVLAKGIGAKITFVTVTPPFHIFTTDTQMIEDTPAQYKTRTAAHAAKTLRAATDAAGAAGVAFDTVQLEDEHPYRAIINTAGSKGCELIVMASHGRHGTGLDAHGWLVLAVGLVIGSLSAFVAICGVMRILERFSAWPFAVYRAFIGAVLLAGVATGWLG